MVGVVQREAGGFHLSSFSTIPPNWWFGLVFGCWVPSSFGVVQVPKPQTKEWLLPPRRMLASMSEELRPNISARTLHSLANNVESRITMLFLENSSMDGLSLPVLTFCHRC